MLDIAKLKAHLVTLERQKESFLVATQQAEGAIRFGRALLAEAENQQAAAKAAEKATDAAATPEG